MGDRTQEAIVGTGENELLRPKPVKARCYRYAAALLFPAGRRVMFVESRSAFCDLKLFDYPLRNYFFRAVLTLAFRKLRYEFKALLDRSCSDRFAV